MTLRIRPGIELWSKEGRELGFPSQGFRVGGTLVLDCFSLNLGIGRLRLWVFVCWGMRWGGYW